MTKPQAMSIHLLMASLLRNIKHQEVTKIVDLLKTQIRKGIEKLHKHNNADYEEMLITSNEIWEYAKKEVNDRHFKISMATSLLALYKLLENDSRKNIWFSDKTFYKAMNSIEESGYGQAPANVQQAEIDANRLITIFSNALGIKADNRLSLLRKKKEYDLILEGKIK